MDTRMYEQSFVYSWIHYQSRILFFLFPRKNNTFLLFFPSKFVLEGKLELL